MAERVEQADALRLEIARSLRRQVSLFKVVVGGFALMGVLLVSVLVGILVIVAGTNRAVDRQVVPLQERVADLEEQVEDLESINDQAVDEVVRLATLLQQNGIDPGTIRIEPED